MSTDGMLTFGDGYVTLSGTLLPGILVSQSIRDAVRYDESRHDHMSGRAKVALGWEDASVTLVLDLVTDEKSDCYEKLQAINKIFKEADRKKATPTVYTVTGRHLRARGINQVVFDALDSMEDDQDDTIQATLTFVEHLPAVIRREKNANAQKAAAGSAPATKAKPAADSNIVQDSDNPFMAGIAAGFK